MAPSSDSEFRDHAANERTMLSWIRTGIAFMGFGFAIARFGLFLREIAQANKVHVNDSSGLGSGWLGVTLVVLGLLTNTAATVRYARLRKAIEQGRSAAPSPAVVFAVGAGSALLAAVMAALLARALAK